MLQGAISDRSREEREERGENTKNSIRLSGFLQLLHSPHYFLPSPFGFDELYSALARSLTIRPSFIVPFFFV